MQRDFPWSSRGIAFHFVHDICTTKALADQGFRSCEDEIVVALKKQGYRITKNAVGDHCVAGFVNIARLSEALRRVVVRVTMMDQYE